MAAANSPSKAADAPVEEVKHGFSSIVDDSVEIVRARAEG